MAKITKHTFDDIARYASMRTGIKQGEAKEVLKALDEFCKEVLEAGDSVKLGNLGTLSVGVVKAKPEREGYSIKTKGITKLPATESYNKITFKVGTNISKEMKDKTYGKLI